MTWVITYNRLAGTSSQALRTREGFRAHQN